MTIRSIPPKQGLYDPAFEHDGCGIGFVVNIKGKASHRIVEQALTILHNLDHRGACLAEHYAVRHSARRHRSARPVWEDLGSMALFLQYPRL